MKTSLKLTALSCFIFLFLQGINSQSVSKKNLIDDGGLSFVSDWKPFYGRDAQTGAKPDTCCLYDAKNGKTAPGSLKLIGNNTTLYRCMRYTKSIPVTVDKSYKISFWVKTANVSLKSRVYLDFAIKDKNESGNPGAYLPRELQFKTHEIAADKIKGTHDWTLIECQIKIPVGGAYLVNIMPRINPTVDDNSTAAVWFDDISIEEVL